MGCCIFRSVRAHGRLPLRRNACSRTDTPCKRRFHRNRAARQLFSAAIPVLLVAERCLLVIRWRRGMIIRIFLAAILIANRTVSGFTTVCFPPGSIVSFCGNHRAVVYNSAAVPANGIARVALFGTGRLLFAACICAGGVKIVVMRVYLTVFNTAGMTPCPFMAVCGR